MLFPRLLSCSNHGSRTVQWLPLVARTPLEPPSIGPTWLRLNIWACNLRHLTTHRLPAFPKLPIHWLIHSCIHRLAMAGSTTQFITAKSAAGSDLSTQSLHLILALPLSPHPPPDSLSSTRYSSIFVQTSSMAICCLSVNPSPVRSSRSISLNQKI